MMTYLCGSFSPLYDKLVLQFSFMFHNCRLGIDILPQFILALLVLAYTEYKCQDSVDFCSMQDEPYRHIQTTFLSTTTDSGMSGKLFITRINHTTYTSLTHIYQTNQPSHKITLKFCLPLREFLNRNILLNTQVELYLTFVTLFKTIINRVLKTQGSRDPRS